MFYDLQPACVPCASAGERCSTIQPSWAICQRCTRNGAKCTWLEPDIFTLPSDWRTVRPYSPEIYFWIITTIQQDEAMYLIDRQGELLKDIVAEQTRIATSGQRTISAQPLINSLSVTKQAFPPRPFPGLSGSPDPESSRASSPEVVASIKRPRSEKGQSVATSISNASSEGMGDQGLGRPPLEEVSDENSMMLD